MATVTSGLLRRVRHQMARIYLFLPSSSSSTSYQCFFHPKSFHSLSSSYLCLHPKPSLHFSTSQCFHSKYSFHSSSSYSSTHPLSFHLLSSHQPCPLTLASLSPSSPSSLHAAPFSTSPLCLKTRMKVEGAPPEGKKKQRPDKSELVTLIDAEDKISAVTLENAERLAKRRDLKLVKVNDSNLKAGKRVYKLMTGKQYFEEEMKAKDEKKTNVGAKDEKNLVIGGKITPHDLGVKLQNIIKWLSKGHQIKVTIISKKATKEDMESVFSAIEKEANKVNARVMQRHEKGDDIRFYIVPPKDESAANREANTDDHLRS
ncbi:Translation initiation factor IF-3, mitochondrial [Portunus trituberculatus]|uniref:Translation initiation factor IF-3, mitochondrial n=1 Tax=Portunus trituberculatus TaxID=210409 RepID=A0A5B7CH64_PORTR|nr:Translation initiation factor IF-3, mitochondrial [Portunus trituberculatus]